MNIRRYLTPKAKAALWQQQDERCARCRHDLALNKSQADHMNPLWCTGDNAADNWQLLCANCHTTKTKREAAARAKTKRLENVRLNGRKVAVSKIEGRGFSKYWRKRMNGTVEVRR